MLGPEDAQCGLWLVERVFELEDAQCGLWLVERVFGLWYNIALLHRQRPRGSPEHVSVLLAVAFCRIWGDIQVLVPRRVGRRRGPLLRPERQRRERRLPPARRRRRVPGGELLRLVVQRRRAHPQADLRDAPVEPRLHALQRRDRRGHEERDARPQQGRRALRRRPGLLAHPLAAALPGPPVQGLRRPAGHDLRPEFRVPHARHLQARGRRRAIDAPLAPALRLVRVRRPRRGRAVLQRDPGRRQVDGEVVDEDLLDRRRPRRKRPRRSGEPVAPRSLASTPCRPMFGRIVCSRRGLFREYHVATSRRRCSFRSTRASSRTTRSRPRATASSTRTSSRRTSAPSASSPG